MSRPLRMKPYLDGRFSYEFMHIRPSIHVNYYLDYATTFAKLASRLARGGFQGILVWNYYYVPLLRSLEKVKKIVDVTDVEKTITHNRMLKGLVADAVKEKLLSDMDLVIWADYASYLERKGEGQVAYVPNGVDLQLLKPDPTAQKEYDSCYLGKMERQYRLETIIEAIARTGGRSLFIGKGPDEDHYRRLAAERKANITFHGYADYQQVPSLLNRCRMGLVPPVQSGSLKLLEYLACGLPAASPGVLDPNLRDGVIAIPGGEVDDYVNAMNMVTEMSKGCYEKMSKRCREASNSFSIDGIGTRYCDLIEAVLQR